MNNLGIIVGKSNPKIGQSIAAKLGAQVIPTLISKFPDNESHIQITSGVRGKDIIIVDSISGNVNDTIIEILLISDAAHRAGAKSISLVAPYMGYMRQDRKDKVGVPISAKVIAKILSYSSIDHVISLDLHAKQNQGFFDVLIEEIFAADVFIKSIKKYSPKNTVLIAPDIGSIKNVRQYSELTKIPYAIIEKERIDHSKIIAHKIFGSVKQKQAIIIDDICESGNTLIQAADLLASSGAKKVVAYVSHGNFVDNAVDKIEKCKNLQSLICTDTIDNYARTAKSKKIKVVSLAEHIAAYINNIYNLQDYKSLFV